MRTNLVRIGNDSGHELRRSSSTKLASPVDGAIPPGLLPSAELDPFLSAHETSLDLLVEHPVHGALDNTEVARAHALVEAADALVADDLPDAVDTILILPMRRGRRRGALSGGGGGSSSRSCDVLVELQACLDHPDRVCGRARGHTRGNTGREVHPGSLFASVEVLGDEMLAVAVDVEAYAARRHDANEVGAETLEEGAGALEDVDRTEDRHRVREMVESSADRVEGCSSSGRCRRCRSGADLGLVEVGLQACLEDIEGRGHTSSRHASYAVVYSSSVVVLPITIREGV